MKFKSFKECAWPALTALALLLAANVAHAQQQKTTPDSEVTVVTLYSETRPTKGGTPNEDKPLRQPIKIVNGGVKSAGDSCWRMSDTGEVTTVPGSCYVLRSAEAGERPPAQ